MKQIAISPLTNKSYTAIYKDKVLGSLHYRHWYSTRGTITMDNGQQYIIERKGFWGTSHEVKKEGKAVLLLKAKWDGGIAIISPGEPKYYFEFKPKGLMGSSYVLINNKQEELLIMTANFSWKKFSSGYGVNCGDNFGNNEEEQLLLWVSVYHFKAAQAMAIAAVAN